MTLERLNPGELYPPFNNRYTQVVISSGSHQIHVAGVIALDTEMNLIGEGDMKTQTRVVMENIGKALSAAGASAADVVRINTFTTNVDEFQAEAHSEVLDFFGATLPASTLVGVTRLADPRYLVEIEVTAVVE